EPALVIFPSPGAEHSPAPRPSPPPSQAPDIIRRGTRLAPGRRTGGPTMRWLIPSPRAGVLATAAILALALPGLAQKAPVLKAGHDDSVTPVAGPSWLTHLGIPLDRTYLGQGAGRYGPAPDQPPEPRVEALGLHRTITLSGEDLYRLNCQACHRDSGKG